VKFVSKKFSLGSCGSRLKLPFLENQFIIPRRHLDFVARLELTRSHPLARPSRASGFAGFLSPFPKRLKSSPIHFFAKTSSSSLAVTLILSPGLKSPSISFMDGEFRNCSRTARLSGRSPL
jgi:hypothetical protein